MIWSPTANLSVEELPSVTFTVFAVVPEANAGVLSALTAVAVRLLSVAFVFAVAVIAPVVEVVATDPPIFLKA